MNSKRANFSSWELGNTFPGLEFLFEFAEKIGGSLDEIFTVELQFEAGKVKRETVSDILKEDVEHTHYYKEPNLENWDDVMQVLQKMSEAVAVIPKLYQRVEELERQRQTG